MHSLRVILSGGLGNQLFQFATGYALSRRLDLPLVLDTHTGFAEDRLYQRQYELNYFKELDRLIPTSPHFSKRAWFWRHLRSRLSLKHASSVASFLGILDERYGGAQSFTQSDTADALPARCQSTQLHGFWQDEEYFTQYEEDLKALLKLPLPTAVGKAPVAMHVRRVQYTAGVDAFYFEEALKCVDQEFNTPDVDVFTDDPEWAEAYFAKESRFRVLSRPGNSGWDDFVSLLGYSNYIISNSTFSWWAAWLSQTSDSLIVCPAGSSWSNAATPSKKWLKIELKSNDSGQK